MSAGRFTVPRPLQLQRVPLRTVLITGAVSYGLLVGAIIEGLPLWAIALVALLPWVPLFTFEAVWQYDHYGFYAFFGALVVLQLGHMGEHAAQLVQLFLTHGNLALSHGIFGQLDLETVHFLWNIGVWLGACALLYRFGSRNPWLWIAFVAASIHMVEHFYLYWLYLAHHEYWLAGGSAGIMAKGGLIGSPLTRPYLHFAYNFFEVTPLVIAFWDQSKIVYDQHLARALPRLSETELVAVTAHLRRLKAAPGEAIVRQGDLADRFYIVSKGEVEVVREDPSGETRLALLRPGQFFGEIGVLKTDHRTATVRATRPTEVLSLDREAFTRLLANSGGRADLDAAVAERLAASPLVS